MGLILGLLLAWFYCRRRISKHEAQIHNLQASLKEKGREEAIRAAEPQVPVTKPDNLERLVIFAIGLYLINLAAKTIQASGVEQAGMLALAARIAFWCWRVRWPCEKWAWQTRSSIWALVCCWALSPWQWPWLLAWADERSPLAN